MGPLLLASFTSALLGDPHCAGMCGGLALAAGDRAFSWNAGRLFTYTVLGALAGQLGRFIPRPAWLPKVLSGVLQVVFAARLAGFLELPHLKLPAWLARFAHRGGFFFGLATGLLPCGLTWTALAWPGTAPWRARRSCWPSVWAPCPPWPRAGAFAASRRSVPGYESWPHWCWWPVPPRSGSVNRLRRPATKEKACPTGKSSSP